MPDLSKIAELMGQNMAGAAKTAGSMKPQTQTGNKLAQLMSMAQARPPGPVRPIQTGRFAGRGNAVPPLLTRRRSNVGGQPSSSRLTTPSMSPQMRRIAMGNRNAV